MEVNYSSFIESFKQSQSGFITQAWMINSMIHKYPLPPDKVTGLHEKIELLDLAAGRKSVTDSLERQLPAKDVKTAILEREFCYIAGNAYESLEKYLKQVIAAYICKNRPSPTWDDRLNADMDFEATRNKLNEIKGRKNGNQYLVKILRRILPGFESIENVNARGINLVDWFYTFTLVRHAVFHNEQLIPVRFYNKLSENKKGTLKKCFPGEILTDGYILKLKMEDVIRLVQVTLEYGILVSRLLPSAKEK